MQINVSQNLQALNCSSWRKHTESEEDLAAFLKRRTPINYRGITYINSYFLLSKIWCENCLIWTSQKQDKNMIIASICAAVVQRDVTLWIWNKSHCETLCESTSHFLFWLTICHTAPCVFGMISNSLNLCNFTLSWGAEPRLSEFWLFVQIENMTTRSVK